MDSIKSFAKYCACVVRIALTHSPLDRAHSVLLILIVPAAIAAFEAKFDAWFKRVSKKLENRDVFTQGDQTHFDDLGVVPVINMWAHPNLNSLFSQLELKIQRLREVEHRARERK